MGVTCFSDYLMNSLFNKIKFTETTKLNKYHDTEMRGLGVSPDFSSTLGMALVVNYRDIKGTT